MRPTTMYHNISHITELKKKKTQAISCNILGTTSLNTLHLSTCSQVQNIAIRKSIQNIISYCLIKVRYKEKIEIKLFFKVNLGLLSHDKIK